MMPTIISSIQCFFYGDMISKSVTRVEIYGNAKGACYPQSKIISVLSRRDLKIRYHTWRYMGMQKVQDTHGVRFYQFYRNVISKGISTHVWIYMGVQKVQATHILRFYQFYQDMISKSVTTPVWRYKGMQKMQATHILRSH